MRKRLGDLLVESGIITPGQLEEALAVQKASGKRLGDVLMELGMITEQQLIEALEFQLGIPHVQLHRQTIDPRVLEMVPERVVRQYTVLPLRIENRKLVVAMADPLDYFAIDELQMITGFPVSPVIASKEAIKTAIERHYGLRTRDAALDEVLQAATRTAEDAQVEDNSPVARMVQQILTHAVRIGASDVHIDPFDDRVRLRLRVDGVLRTEREYPPAMHAAILTRLKVMAGLNITEKRLPQDGRFELTVEGRPIDVRLSTLPTVHGEKAVLRLLDSARLVTDVDKLGFSPRAAEHFRELIRAPHGMVLITGPTGSGKTTTLYAALRTLNRDEVNIVTIEDPVEYQLPGIHQVQVNPQIGLTFARGLRAILRQDPNIIMVGEIRDRETAEIATRAALTGHLVLSTLHTNDAVGALTRLVDMGVEPYLVASSVRGVVAQRLVRRVCPRCKTAVEPTAEEREVLASHGLTAERLFRGQGCGECSRTGYLGRTAIQEVFVVDRTVREMLVRGRSETEILAHLQAHGFVPMIRDGLEKVVAGVTTMSEVLQVTRV